MHQPKILGDRAQRHFKQLDNVTFESIPRSFFLRTIPGWLHFGRISPRGLATDHLSLDGTPRVRNHFVLMISVVS
jgi:hypothetical protein